MTDLIKACKLWARVSAKTGGTYYVGRMGGCRVMVMENRDRQGDDDPSHFLLLGDAEKPPERPVERGSGWRGPEYRRQPRDGPGRPPAAPHGAFLDDTPEDADPWPGTRR
jgi:hypothetical protein